VTDLQVLDDPAGALAERLAEAAGRGAHVALTGGSTPRAAYERAAELDADWSGATLWFGDERCVPPDDARSNYGMAKAALIDRLPSGNAGPAVHRMRGEAGPNVAADDYERELRATLGEQMPRLDMVLLGLGSDGHVASLFPGSPALEERERVVMGVEEAGLEPFVPRVTLTLPAIDAAREIVFLVTGTGKAEAVARAFEGGRDPDVPASLVAPADGTVTVLLDELAARELRERP
jgi:6-phosphogluconolactonase